MVGGDFEMTDIQLLGGGPGDGQELTIYSIEKERKLQEKKYGEGFFWVFLHSCGLDAHIYVEEHPHFEPDFMPPKQLQLWYTNQIPLTDLE